MAEGTSSLTRTVTSGSETIGASIGRLEMPFERQLKKFVVANDSNVDSIINDIKTLLSNLKGLSVAVATTLLDPSGYDSAYVSSILTSLGSTITTNLADAGTGLPTTTETAMYNRLRARRRFESSRTSRRITEELSKRLPYAGMMADKLTEADQDEIKAMEELEWRITEKQNDVTYQFQRDKIREAIAYEQFKINDHHVNKDRKLRADIALDEMEIRNHWSYFEFLMKRAIQQTQVGIDFALKAASGADQITFENWLKMSRIMGDAQLEISALVANLLPSAQTV